MNKQVALYRSRKARHMLASPTSYKADPEIELKPSPIEAERCSLFWSFHLLPLPGVQRLGMFSISKMIAKILQKEHYYKVPALPVSLLAAWLSLSGSRLKGDFLKPSTFAWLSLSGSHLSGSFLQTAKQLALAPALEPLAIMIHGPRFNFHISVFAKTLVWRYNLQECNGTEIWCDSGYYTGTSGDQCWYGNYCLQLVCKYLNY